jgi:transcriptional regulator GlxA family with amidase domain
MPRNLAILLFDQVEILDFAGPYEVFAVAHNPETREPLFNIYTVAERGRPIVARNGLSVNPDYTLYNAPKADIALLPGGDGRRQAMVNPAILDWVRQQAETVEHLLSVCTGAFFLARTGLLDGLGATTYHTAFDELAQHAPHTTLHPGERWVDNGKIITSAGVSAGIDMALHVVSKLHGEAQAVHTARYMEYDYYPRTR